MVLSEFLVLLLLFLYSSRVIGLMHFHHAMVLFLHVLCYVTILSYQWQWLDRAIISRLLYNKLAKGWNELFFQLAVQIQSLENVPNTRYFIVFSRVYRCLSELHYLFQLVGRNGYKTISREYTPLHPWTKRKAGDQLLILELVAARFILYNWLASHAGCSSQLHGCNVGAGSCRHVFVVGFSNSSCTNTLKLTNGKTQTSNLHWVATFFKCAQL